MAKTISRLAATAGMLSGRVMTKKAR